MKEKLAEAETALREHGDGLPATPHATAGHAGASTCTEGTVEDVTPPADSAGTGMGADTTAAPAQEEAVRRIQEDPGTLKQTMERMQGMSQEQLDAVAGAGGLPAGARLTPAMVEAAAQQLGRMGPEELERAVRWVVWMGGAVACGLRSGWQTEGGVHDVGMMGSQELQLEFCTCACCLLPTCAAPALVERDGLLCARPG